MRSGNQAPIIADQSETFAVQGFVVDNVILLTDLFEPINDVKIGVEILQCCFRAHVQDWPQSGAIDAAASVPMDIVSGETEIASTHQKEVGWSKI